MSYKQEEEEKKSERQNAHLEDLTERFNQLRHESKKKSQKKLKIKEEKIKF